MNNKSFIKKSHFRIYDTIIPIFRLASVIIIIAFIIYNNGLEKIHWNFGFAIIYLIYALFLVIFKKLREIIILKYTFIIGICETLIITYGIVSTGGEASPLYFCYILVITFFGVISQLSYFLIITIFCGICYIGALLLLGSGINANIAFKVTFIFSFSIFLELVNGRVSKYNIKMAMYDQLTKLYNRQYFYGELDGLLAHSQNKQITFSLVVIDVNDFKIINDTYGHLEGDRILMAIGELIQRNIGKNHIAARYGGDEFVILMQKTGRDKAKEICEYLKRELKEKLKGQITVSIGLAVFPEDGINVENLLHAADMAMYDEKSQKDFYKR